MNIRTTLISALMLALGGMATSAFATQTIGQQNVATAASTVSNIGTLSPIVAQSFTAATDGFINFATFSLYVTTSPAPATVSASYEVNLFSGNGLFDAAHLIATSDPEAVAFAPQSSLISQPVQFDFTSLASIALVAGNSYTLELVQYSSSGPFKLGVLISKGDLFAGGTWFNGATLVQANTTNDLIFSEGFDPSISAVPEPANAALLMAGLGFMGLVSRRRKASK